MRAYLRCFTSCFNPLPVALLGLWLPLMLSVALVSVQCARKNGVEDLLQPPVKSEKGDWPHTNSDLKPDPSIVTGRLPNGFRYIVKENRTPRDRVSMHLYVQAGSLDETDSEQGIAHFLEHMLFNGSTHFPPGEMVKFFQRIGMQFGPDANAHTGFDRTVFDILLPDGRHESINEGFMVLKDYAQGALLDPSETEKEKKVILAEMRSRDSAEFRMLKDTFMFEMQGSLIPRRFPIGQEAVLRQIDAAMLRNFYETWYRPERLVLVMVGDVSTDEVIPLIAEGFGGLQGRRPAAPSPSLGEFRHDGIQSFHRYESETGVTTVRIETVEQSPQPIDSVAWQHKKLLHSLADEIVQKRLEAILQRPDTVFSDVNAGSGTYLQQIKYAEVSADCKPENWRQALTALEQELRKALEFGFTRAEVERVAKEYRAELTRDLEESQTRDSMVLARRIMGDLGNWQVFQSPRQRLELLSALLSDVSPDQLHQAFKETWSLPHRLILVTGNVDLSMEKTSPRDQILAVYEGSRNTAVQPPVETAQATFPYLQPLLTAAPVKANATIADIGVTRVTFENGFQLLFKQTPFKKNQLLMALSFGGGKASEPEDQPGLAEFTEAVVNASGFGSMDRTALEAALAGHLARIELEVREDNFVVKGETPTDELPLLVELLYTFVQDPGFRTEARLLAQNRYQQFYESMAFDVEGVMRSNGQRFLAGGDARFGMPAWQEFQSRTLDQARMWFEGQLRSAPLELAVVGDFDPDLLIDYAGRFFGGLAEREAGGDQALRPAPVFPAGQSLALSLDSKIRKSLAVVAYPTEDFWDIKRTRRLNILADIFTERLRERVREKMGAAYSPFAYNHPYRAYPGFGIFQVYLNVDPRQARDLLGEVKGIASRLAHAGIDADEFRRALDPALTRIKDLRQSNSYWLNSVLIGASRHGDQLEWCRTIEKDYAGIRMDEIVNLAQHYLDNTKAATILIAPQ
jgi:zinc protease